MGYDQNSKAYRLINNETLKLILQHSVVFNDAMWFSMKKLQVALWKHLSQKEHEQVFPYIKEQQFDIDQNIFLKSVPPSEIIHLEKQMNPSC